MDCSEGVLIDMGDKSGLKVFQHLCVGYVKAVLGCAWSPPVGPLCPATFAPGMCNQSWCGTPLRSITTHDGCATGAAVLGVVAGVWLRLYQGRCLQITRGSRVDHE